MNALSLMSVKELKLHSLMIATRLMDSLTDMYEEELCNWSVCQNCDEKVKTANRRQILSLMYFVRTNFMEIWEQKSVSNIQRDYEVYFKSKDPTENYDCIAPSCTECQR